MSLIFEIHFTARDIHFHAGYCAGWERIDEQLHVIDPFCRATIHTLLGPIPCRGPWRGPHVLSESKYSLSPCAKADWMEIAVTDVLFAELVCEECSIDLPSEGFRRV